MLVISGGVDEFGVQQRPEAQALKKELPGVFGVLAGRESNLKTSGSLATRDGLQRVFGGGGGR